MKHHFLDSRTFPDSRKVCYNKSHGIHQCTLDEIDIAINDSPLYITNLANFVQAFLDKRPSVRLGKYVTHEQHIVKIHCIGELMPLDFISKTLGALWFGNIKPLFVQ